MKLYKVLSVALAGFALIACSDIDTQIPESGTMLATQVQETNLIAPSRAEASFAGLFSSIGQSAKMYSTPDDWQFLMINFCNDLEGADALIADSGYNWFSVCGELSSRNANYRNPTIRYRAPYSMIANVNTFILSYPEDVDDPDALNMLAQARALRAYSYMMLAPSFQFAYEFAADQPCVPLVTESFPEDFTNNPRATVREIYEQVIKDLDYAVEHLEGSSRTSKAYVDGNVAHGLRARAYLYMGEWAKALADAQAAASGYTPASLEDVSRPYFMDIKEGCWIWGYDMTVAIADVYPYATTSSWLRSFSANGYAPAVQCYTCINKLLYDKIPASDVRKGWWVDENLESPLLDGLKWPGFDDVANADDGGDTKSPFLPYTNVKFGCLSIGTQTNDEDMPLMRVEEMILIQAECQARLGKTSDAVSTLTNFVKTYRDPQYDVNGRGLSLMDEIWFQRRVELWGEGFFVSDAKRLNKPTVRFHDDTGNIAPAFRFNLAANDPWLLMRFPQGEMNTNFGIVDNSGGHQPVTDEGKELRDGVTD
ncbi:MAG: RagB/SusD family nutrient uptake outer membrane protein [Bacteroidales bacterium]|nr:RagB/SusD family nutrient uptake outer membrane protein [Bacteroidales bacterium]MBR5054802.1 RagB/SusD family nutrient uptake outer membrane protein [Bacteroidales bacterium]MBR5073356.1 RagB/SusD family nutrient uptake outer membrane protein [Bacteroidales bacterium]